jgi:imidazolonepropionase-like amidohydrolase
LSSFSSDLILTHGVLIDGSGAAPLPDASIVIRDGKIVAIGPGIAPIPNTKVIDLQGRTVLPGFFNCHVHRAFKEDVLCAWAREGVTTVRDLGASLRKDQFARRDRMMQYNRHARLVAVGPIISGRGGYGTLKLTSPEQARSEVRALAEAGADLIKIGLEDMLQFRRYQLMPLEIVRAVVAAAHDCHLRVAAHVSRARHLALAIEGGVDEAAHMIVDDLPEPLLAAMIARGMIWVPTLELWAGVSQMYHLDWHARATENLKRYVQAGGQVAIGTDYAGYGCEFELGMPLKEMRWMQTAGMTPTQIITAGTCNAARACGLADTHGALQVGKVADLVVVDGDPLVDLAALKCTFLVIHRGEKI